MSFVNSYADPRRAAAYATLGFPGTYYLAFRDLPAIIAARVPGGAALDFGCGTGRSTRFLRRLGFDVIGVDVAAAMLDRARQADPGGDYRLVREGKLDSVSPASFDLVFSAFTFDNIPGRKRKISLFRQLRALLRGGGGIVNLVSTPDIYTHEWASFSTRDFPENLRARPGERVRTVMKDVDDPRPVDDILWPDDAYREVYAAAGLQVAEVHRPLAKGDEPIDWVNETRIAPWCVYLLTPAGSPLRPRQVEARGRTPSQDPGSNGVA
jgi:SAM-dependent methyltransferase